MQALLSEIAAVTTCEVYGRVRSIQGLLVGIAGPINTMSVGSRLRLRACPPLAHQCNRIGANRSGSNPEVNEAIAQ